jgi:hypothetical protein
MDGNTKQTRADEGNQPASSEVPIETNRSGNEKIYWGILCRTCRELVAYDIRPYVSFGPGAASMRPGAVRCGHGHTHIYFPRDFQFFASESPIEEAVMLENREAYNATNPASQDACNRPVTALPKTELTSEDDDRPTVATRVA